MNDLYLIGNGFDLAHGLKTSYNDFLLWYLNGFLKNLWNKTYYEDDLMKVQVMGSTYQLPSNFTSIKDVMTWLEEHNYFRESHHDFFDKILKNYRNFKWVDIEYEYYLSLIDLYKKYERNVFSSRVHFCSLVKDLNTCFDFLKKNLIAYLQTIEITSKQENMHLESILLEGNGPKQNEKGEKLYVYFNYTATMELYSRNFIKENNLVYIHGDLQNLSNPVIFGFGDEMDNHYGEVEDFNNNELLMNIKSFGYFKTNNYQRVNSFIEGDGKEFTVKILGHSCGLSDRILLNTIFEHPNCKWIKIYYHQKSQYENDHFEKTQEISRHFKASEKGNMRARIVSFTDSDPLLPLR
jgi:hypothetical protein